ncbi:efflux RND transporter periplasmic adaptor subunit [Bremerella sp. JC817]|uniref:efflux RND transporter periplasmic adaptor subunit n=1 Tax=Bremerella sp. JC817 TaxID=3231756 RepID=UPI00345A6450
MNISSSSSSRESFFARKWTKRQLWTLRFFGVVGVAVLAALMTWKFTSAESVPLPPPTAEPTPVEVFAAKSQPTYAARRTYTGVLVAARTSELSFELAGKVIRLTVDEGDTVKQGQTLATLDDRHLAARIRKTEAQRDQQAAILRELIAGPRREVIEAAEAEVRQLSAELKLQEANRGRREQLIKRSAISQETLEDAIYGTQAAQGRFQAAESRLEELREGTRPEQIEAQKAVVAGLEADLADLMHEKEDTQLVAPFSGKIARRSIDEGTVVSPGQSVFRLVEHEPLEAWFGLPPETAASLEVGQQHPIVVDGQTQVASVSGIIPELDSTTRTQTVVFTLSPEASRKWVPAQVARLEIGTTRQATGFWVPNASLLQGSRGLWSLYVVEADSTIGRREVEVIYSDSQRSFVRGTIVDGDQIVASGINRLVPGVQVHTQPLSE